MTYKYGPFEMLNTEQYRKAKRKVREGKVAVYPKLDSQGNLVYFVMHRTIKSLQILCDQYVDCPRHFIRTHKKSRYGYHYLYLTEQHARTWRDIMEKFTRRTWEEV